MADRVSAPLGRPPVGLLELINGKVLGQNPDTLLSEVRATIDVGSMLASGVLQRLTTSVISSTSTGIQTTVPLLQVPFGETWIPISMSCLAVGDGSGDSVRAVPVITSGQTSGNIGVVRAGREAIPIPGTSANLNLSTMDFDQGRLQAYPSGTVFTALFAINTAAFGASAFIELHALVG